MRMEQQLFPTRNDQASHSESSRGEYSLLSPATNRNGAALILTLLILMILTSVGMSSLFVSAMDQKMTGNYKKQDSQHFSFDK